MAAMMRTWKLGETISGNRGGGNRVGSVKALRWREFSRGLPGRRWAVRVGELGISGGTQRMPEGRDEEGGNCGGQGVCREEGGGNSRGEESGRTGYVERGRKKDDRETEMEVEEICGA